MIRRTGIVCALFLAACTLSAQETQRVSIAAGGGGNLSIGNLSDYGQEGAHGMVRLGYIPIPNTAKEVELGLSGAYFVIPTDRATTGDVTFILGGLDLRLYAWKMGSSRMYVTMGAGVARVAWDRFPNQTPPPGVDQKFTSTSPYGAGGLGIELGRKGSPIPFIETALTNVSGPKFGNLYTLRLTGGLRL